MFRTMKFAFLISSMLEEVEPEVEKLAEASASPEGLTAREIWPFVKKGGDALMETPAGDMVIYHHRAKPHGNT